MSILTTKYKLIAFDKFDTSNKRQTEEIERSINAYADNDYQPVLMSEDNLVLYILFKLEVY